MLFALAYSWLRLFLDLVDVRLRFDVVLRRHHFRCRRGGRPAKNDSTKAPLKRLSPLGLCLATTPESFTLEGTVRSVYVAENAPSPGTTVDSEAALGTPSDASNLMKSVRRQAADCSYSIQSTQLGFPPPDDEVAMSHPAPAGGFMDYVFVRVNSVIVEVMVVTADSQHLKYAAELANKSVVNATAVKP